MIKTSFVFIACAIGCTLSTSLAAEEAPTPNRHTVIVPYDGEKPVGEQAPERFYLDYATFQDLWMKAKTARVRESTDVDPAEVETADFTFSSSLHHATISEEKIEVVAHYQLQTRGSTWQKVPFAFEGATAREITLDGSAAALQDGHLLVDEAGAHQVEVRYEIAAKEDWRTLSWKTPVASATMLAIEMPDDRLEPNVDGAVLISDSDSGKPVYTAALGNRSEIKLERRARGLNSSKLERPRFAQIESVLAVRKGVMQLSTKVGFEFPGAELERFAIALDDVFTPVKFSAPNLASWGLTALDDGTRRLEFALTEPVLGALAVELSAESPLQQLAGPSAFPKVVAEAVRAEHTMIVAAGSGLAVTTKPQDDHRRVTIPANCVLPDAKNVAAFASLSNASRLQLDIAPAPPKREAKIDYAFQVSGTKLEIVASLELTSEADLLDVAIDLPDGTTIDYVEGPPGSDWIEVDRQLRLRLPPLPEGETTTGVIVGLVREFADEQQTLTLTPISLPGFDEVRGTGAVVAHAAKETVLRFDQERHVVREVEASQLKQEIEVIAPFVRKHGFTFEEGAFSASLQLSDLTPQFDTRSVLFAQVYDTWVSLTYNLDVEIQRSAINTISFSLPESLPEGRILSDELREATSEVVDSRRVYTATFQRDVLDFLNFSVQTEAPLVGGEADLEDLLVNDTRRMERFIVLETRTNDELSTTLTNVESVPKEHVPYLPQTLLNAQYFQAAPGWTFGVQSEKLESTAGNDAVITECELATAFRANGEEWHRATYKMLNRSLQFLPVKLDPNAELVTVTVSDEEVRADQGAVDGQDVLLVPLIQTQPGELSYAVELVYRRAASTPQLQDKTFEITLDDPQIIGQTVEQTFWQVFAPAGYAVKDVDGNMEEITPDDRLGAKIEANLTEMKRLSQLAQLSGRDYSSTDNNLEFGTVSVAQRARQNLESLAIGNGGLIQRFRGDRRRQSQWDDDNRKLQTQLNLAGQVEAVQQQTQNGDIIVAAGSEIFVNGSQSHGNGGFIVNAGKIAARNTAIAERSYAQLGHVNEQVRVNDNISVGNRYVQKGGQVLLAEPAKPSKGKDDFEFSGKQIGHGGWEQKGHDVKTEKNVPMNFRARGDAYTQIGHGGRSARQEQEGNITVDVQTPNQPAAPNTWGNQSGNISINSNGVVQLDGDMSRNFAQIGHGGYNNAVDQLTAGVVVDTMQQQMLRPKGRVSLQVAFPTVGEPRYFKKLKDHAQLTLDFAEVSGNSTYNAWVWLISLLVLLGLVNRFTKRPAKGEAG